ncbi:MAG: hypothetical protein ACE5KZ_01940 [Candidatus Scalinduaceae bacterium]
MSKFLFIAMQKSKSVDPVPGWSSGSNLFPTLSRSSVWPVGVFISRIAAAPNSLL